MAGLTINSGEFLRLPQKQQLKCLYENQVMQFQKFDELEKLIKGYKFHQKIQYPWMTGLTGGFIFLIKHFFSRL